MTNHPARTKRAKQVEAQKQLPRSDIRLENLPLQSGESDSEVWRLAVVKAHGMGYFPDLPMTVRVCRYTLKFDGKRRRTEEVVGHGLDIWTGEANARDLHLDGKRVTSFELIAVMRERCEAILAAA